MQSVSELKTVESDAAPERERSTIDFPYTDLDNAADVVRGVYNAGGMACEFEQLAAQLNVEAKGGGFRLRINGAKSYGLITYERGGRISLTDLGRQLIDPHTERLARMNAFLSVPLYVKVYEQFRGGPLPPQAGLERAIESMGVGAKVKDKARQVLLRSAKQAGFFDAASDRLVKPNIRDDQGGNAGEKQAGAPEERKPQKGGGGGGGQDDLHPLIQGLLMTLPPTGADWSGQERVNWLTMASSIFKMIYKSDDGSDIAISMTSHQGGSNSAT